MSWYKKSFREVATQKLTVAGAEISAGSFGAGMFGTKVWHVDGTDGSDGNVGNSSTNAVETIQRAIDLAGSQDTIYVRVLAPDADASEPGTYEEDLEIAYAKHGLRIIGCSPQLNLWAGPKIKNATATILLNVLASGVHLENLQFNCTRNSGTYGVYLDGIAGYATKAGSVGANIINCFLKNSSTTYGGISLIGGYGSTVYGLHTYYAENAIWMSSNAIPSNGHSVLNSHFKDNNGAAVTCHITTIAGAHVGWLIKDCTFGRATTFITVGANNSGLISRCDFEDLTATLANSTGKVKIPVGTQVAVTGCSGGVGLDVIQSQA